MTASSTPRPAFAVAARRLRAGAWLRSGLIATTVLTCAVAEARDSAPLESDSAMEESSYAYTVADAAARSFVVPGGPIEEALDHVEQQDASPSPDEVKVLVAEWATHDLLAAAFVDARLVELSEDLDKMPAITSPDDAGKVAGWLDLVVRREVAERSQGGPRVALSDRIDVGHLLDEVVGLLKSVADDKASPASGSAEVHTAAEAARVSRHVEDIVDAARLTPLNDADLERLVGQLVRDLA